MFGKLFRRDCSRARDTNPQQDFWDFIQHARGAVRGYRYSGSVTPDPVRLSVAVTVAAPTQLEGRRVMSTIQSIAFNDYHASSSEKLIIDELNSCGCIFYFL